MKIQEAIDRIRLFLDEESTSKYPQFKNDAEALSRLKSAKENLERIKESSLDKEELVVPEELAELLDKKRLITPKTAFAIHRAVDDWREDRDHKKERGIEMKGKSKKSMRKNPLFWIVFVFFIAMLIFSLVIAFVPEETIPQWIVFVFSPVGAVGACLQIALSLREWRSDRKHGENESKTQDSTSSDISVRIDDHSKRDDHSKHDDHSKKFIVKGDLNVNKNPWVLVIVAIVAIVAIIMAGGIVAMVITANREKSPTSSNTSDATTGSQQEAPPAKNPDMEYDGFDVIFNEDGETATVSINTQKEGTEIEFPSKILHEGKEYRVTAVGRAGLTKNDKIQSVNLSTSIERIESGAFANFSALKDIFLPGSLTYIGQNAFVGCTNLKTVNADDLKSWCRITFEGQNSNPLSLNDDSVLTIAGKAITGEPIIEGIDIIPAYTFRNTDISCVTFESGVTAIGTKAFFNCTQLATVWDKCALNIEKGSTGNGYVGYYAEHIYSVDSETGRIATEDGYLFDESGTPSLVEYSGNAEALNLPAAAPHGSPYEIAEDVFRNHASITSVTIPDGVTKIGDNAFYGCNSLRSITLPFVGNGAEITYFSYLFGGSSYLYSWYVPDSLQEVIITSGTSIGEGAFYECDKLTSITIPDVTMIGASAFYGCGALTSISIPDVTMIGASAFYGCSSLTTVAIGKNLTEIGDKAFYNCSMLARVDVSDISAWCKIDFGGLYANPLYYAKHLYLTNGEVTDLSVSDGITEIKPYAFCSGAFASVTIGESVNSIGISAFYDCTAVTRVTIGDGVTSIGDNAFENCPIEEATISAGAISSIPRDGLQKVVLTSGAIAAQAFYHCGSLTNVTIEGSVTSVGDGAFGNCSLLESVTFDENGVLTSIGSSAFADCSLLTRIEIPKNVSAIGNNAFDKCSSLTDITIPKDLNSIGSSAFDGCPIQEAIMPAIAISSIPKSQLIEVTVTSGAISARAFYNCSSLTSAKIEDGVTSIGESAFYGCDSLRSITLPFVGNGVEITYFSYLFGGSSYSYSWHVPESLQEVIITGGTSIGVGAFYRCDKLTSITIPGSVTSLGDEAFYGCGALTSITIPDSVNSIGNKAFYFCSGLLSVTIPDGVTSFGAEVFCGCNSLESVTFGDDCRLTSMDRSFYGCNLLESVTFGDDCQLTSLDYTFYGCNSLESVTFGDNCRLTSIGDYAFWDCRRLFGIELPEGVTSIGESAFGSCYLLTYITIPASVKSIGDSAFLGCFNLLEVWNYSQLPLTKGEDSYGDVARFAENVYETSEKSKQTVTEEGYIFYEEGEKIYLIGYKGKQTALTLPALSPSGKSYEINDFAFYNCTALKNIKIPDSITSIDGFAFHGCSLLESVTFGEKSQLISIEIMAFEYCSSLTSIQIPDSVKSIGDWAFNGCSSLKNIVIPENVTSIGSEAFEGCTNLTIYCEASEKPSGWDENWNPDNRPVIWGYKGKK